MKLGIEITLARPKLYPSSETGFIRPCTADVAHGVPPASEQKQRAVERLYELDTVRMA